MKLLHLLVIVLLIVCSAGRADTTWVASGNVSGVWNSSGSPYMIHLGDITVATGQTLLINPGVKVYFAGQFKLIVNGLLQAIGSQSDSIWFTGSAANFPFASPVRWRGIRFENADENCQLSYCSISYGGATGAGILGSGGGLYCLNTDLEISHSWIHHCHAFHNCAAVFDQSDIVLEYTNMTHNSGTVDPEYYILNGEVGAFATGNSTMHIRHCNIQFNNPGGNFSAIRFGSGSVVTMDSCLINENQNSEGGFGPMMIDPLTVVTMTGTTISNHHPMFGFDGGIRCVGTTLTMEACTLRNNSASWNMPYETGGSSGLTILDPVSATISNSVFEGHIGQFGAASLCENTTFTNCDFRDNISSDGAVFSNGGNRFVRCSFENNSAAIMGGLLGNYGNGRGGAIVFFSGTDSVSQCTFDANTSYIFFNEGEPADWDTLSTVGGALYCHSDASPYIVNSVFVNNDLNHGSQFGTGSVLYNSGGHPTFEFCTMNDNSASGHPGGVIFLDGGSLTMNGCVVSNSTATAGIYFDQSAGGDIRYCDFFGVSGQNFLGTPPAGLGVISTTNANGDACDQYYNIYLDPEYVDVLNGDLHLADTSPCVGAADPSATVAADYENNARPLPAGSIRDIGAFENTGGTLAVVDNLVIQPDYDGNDVVLYWNAIGGAQSYQVYSGEAQEYVPGLFTLIGTTVDTTFVDSDVLLQPAMQKTYVVRASALP